MDRGIKNSKKVIHSHIPSIWIIVLFLYPLLMPRSLKLLYSPKVSGIASTNELYVIGCLAIIGVCGCIFNTWYKGRMTVSQITALVILISLYITFSTFVNTPMNEQNIYALVVTTLPLVFLFIPRVFLNKKRENFTNFSAIVAIAYSILAIYNTTHSTLSIGNAYVISSSQARVSLPIGSPTTVVFFFIVSLPIVNLAITNQNNKVLKTIFQIGFGLIVIASILTLSRAGVAVIIVLTAWCLFNRSKKTTMAKRVLGIVVLLAVGLFASSYIFSNFDLSRLFMGFSDSSVYERNRGAILFIEIFKRNPLLGSGCGSYFTRVYKSLTFSDRIISAYGYSGLVDPHNAYILILSECGIVGLILFIYLFYWIYKRFCLIKNPDYKSAALQLLAGLLAYSISSSDIFNLVGLSAIIYTYIAFFLYYQDRFKYEHQQNIMYKYK